MKRIICIGNRYSALDSAGPAVYDLLAQRQLQSGLELIDGGLGGLNLIPLFEGVERVVLVDAISGFTRDAEPVILDPREIALQADEAYGHAAGLPFLLRMLPEVLEGEMPQVVVVGIEGHQDASGIARAADLAERLAVEGTCLEVGNAQEA